MGEGVVRRILSALLRLYPAEFRDALGDDLVETAVHRWREAKRTGGVGGARFWVSDGLRFGIDGVLERMRALPAVVADAREAWRHVVRKPGQHVVPVLTLAIGLAATTTIFTLADAVVFRPLPYPAAGDLYLIHARFGSLELSSNSLLNLRDLQSSVTTMSWIAGAEDASPALTAAGAEPERVSALTVTEEYLPGLGARVRVGRGFQAEDFARGAPRVAIVSDGLWQRRWGGEARVLGSAIQLNGVEHIVIGVMAGGFRDPGPIESGAVTSVWSAAREGDRRHRDDYGFRLLGRLAPGSSLDAAQRELASLGARLSAAHPAANRLQGQDLSFVLHRLHEQTVGTARARLLLLLGAVALLLVLSCANVANLFFARGITRTAELAVRCALGATRARLATQLFVESLLTAAAAGIVAAVLAAAALRVFVLAAPAGLPRLHEIALDWRAFTFIAALTALTAVFFGSLPALRASQQAVAASTPRMTGSRQTQRVQSALVAAEIALALVLLTGSALLLASLRHLLRVEPGFDASDVTLVDVRPPVAANSHQLALEFYASLTERAAAVAGVTSAAVLHTVPGVTGGMWSRVTPEYAVAAAAVERGTAPAVGERPGEEMYRVNPMYGDAFAVLDIPLLAGRTFDGDPRADEPYVVIVNEAAARVFFPQDERPIGRRLTLAGAGVQAPLREIIGSVRDVRQRGPEHDAEPQIYVPYGQRDVGRLTLLIETASGATLSQQGVQRAVRAVDDAVPIDAIEALSSRYAVTTEQSRLLTLLLSVFAGIGLMLAVVGTYATTAHTFAQRMREFGIRLALGSRSEAVFRLVIARALFIAALGILGGLLLSLALTRFLASYIYGVTIRDPVAFAAAAVLVGVSALLASVGPALRAMRLDPNDVLRSED